MRIYLATALLLLVAAAFAQDDLGPKSPVVKMDAAPVITATQGKAATVPLLFRVAPGYHINSNQPKAEYLIPTNQISSQAKAILAYFPQPNTQQISGAPFVNNYAGNGAVAINGNQFNTREDYYLNPNNTIFGRYSFAEFTEVAPGAFGLEAGGPQFGNYAGNSKARNQSLALGWTRILSPTLINEFRFGWMRYHVFDTPNGFGTSPAKDAGIPGLNLDSTYTSGMPYFYIPSPNDSYQLGYALGVNQCNCPLTQTERQYQFVDNLSKTMGKHALKFGADLRYAQNLRVPSDTHRAGELTFNGGVTGNVAAV